MEDEGNRPGVRSPPIICDLGSSRFVAALARPLSYVTVLRAAAFAEDDEVFPGLCEADDGADGCFQICDRLMEGVTDRAVIESFKVETIVAINIRNQIRDQRPTFVVGIPEPAVVRRNEPVPPGVRLEDVLWREVQPVSGGGTQMRRTVVRVPPVFVIELNRLCEDSGPDGDGGFQVRDTPVLFPPAIDLDPIFGLGEETVLGLRAVVVDGGSQGDEGHIWCYVGLGDRWFELDGMSRAEVSFEDMAASQLLKGVVGLFYVEPPVEAHWSRVPC
jgi:hypothetical protein